MSGVHVEAPGRDRRRTIRFALWVLVLSVLAFEGWWWLRANLPWPVRAAAPATAPETALDPAPPGVVPRILVTGALPLRIVTDEVARRSALAPGAGAVALAGADVVLLDRLGRLFLYRRGAVVEHAAPPLPMNVESFEADGRFALNETTLIAHDLKWDPSQGLLWASFERWRSDVRAPVLAIASCRFVAGRCSAWTIRYESPPIPLQGYYSGRAASGKMLLAGRYLYLAAGDYNLDRGDNPAAQDPAAFPGKIWRLDLRSGRARRVALGVRNPEGLALRSDGSVWADEHGERGGDRLERIMWNANYGWPDAGDGGQRYGAFDFQGSGGAGHRALQRWRARFRLRVSPSFVWEPSIAPSALLELRNFDPAWDGDFLMGSLKAMTIYRIRMDGDRVTFVEPIWIGRRIRDIAAGRGLIVVLTDDGAVLFIRPARDLIPRRSPDAQTPFVDNELTDCTMCHGFEPGQETGWAPSLYRIVGRPIGADRFPYSDGLRRVRGVWSEQTLTAFLANPQAFAPGSNMPNLGYSPERVRRVVECLKWEDDLEARTDSSQTLLPAPCLGTDLEQSSPQKTAWRP